MDLPLNINFQQILLHLMNFSLLTLGLYVILYKPVKSFMDGRRKYYEDIDAEARGALAEAEKLRLNYEEKLRCAEEEIAREKAEASISIENESELVLAEARKKSEKILSEAHETARAEKKKLLAEAEAEISGLIVTAAEKLMIGADPDDGRLYDSFLEKTEVDRNDK